MQTKYFILEMFRCEGLHSNVDELNRLIFEGWEVVETERPTDTRSSVSFLVIRLEKENI